MFRATSSTFRADTPLSGGGDGGVDDSTGAHGDVAHGNVWVVVEVI